MVLLVLFLRGGGIAQGSWGERETEGGNSLGNSGGFVCNCCM